MPFGRSKRLQRAVGRIYLLLTKEAAVEPNVDLLDDFRAAEADRDGYRKTFRHHLGYEVIAGGALLHTSANNNHPDFRFRNDNMVAQLSCAMEVG